MGIFNEQSFNHPFARGIQGAPGVGFSLTSDGNYDMTGKNSLMLEHPQPIMMQQQKSMLMIMCLLVQVLVGAAQPQVWWSIQTLI